MKNSNFIRITLAAALLAAPAGLYAESTAEESVVVGYTERPASEVTTAVTTVKAVDLSRSSLLSTESALAGKATGLTVMRTSGSQPGAEINALYIRGVGSENSYTAPYVLVDGIERSLSSVDVNEIESITILKDGASNAIYGQRGANGTILVTTKRGREGKPVITFSTQLGWQSPTHRPEFLGSADYVSYYTKALINDGLNVPTDLKYNPSSYMSADRNQYLYPDVNWYDEFVARNSFQQQYRLSMNGGTKVVRYFMFLGYAGQDGLLKHTDLNKGFNTNLNYERFNIRANIDANITNTLTAALDIATIIENRNRPNVETGTLFSTLSSITPNAMPVTYEDGSLAGTSLYQENPLGMISRTGYTKSRSIGLQIRAKLKQELDMLTPGLSAELVFGYDGTSTYGLTKTEKYATHELQPDGTFSTYGEDVPLALNLSANDKAYQYLMGFYGGLNYKRYFGIHTVGANVRYYQNQLFVRGDNSPYGKQGVNGTVSYDFDKRYFIDFAFSYDGSDEYAPGKRFGFFPAVSAAWNISNESFLKGSPAVTLLKLRASYGEAGNCKTIGFDRYAWQSHWYGYDNSWGGYIFGTGFSWSDGAWEGRQPNPDLTWERTRNYNVGVDLSLFDRLTVNIDGFIHKRGNTLLTLTNSTAATLGMPAPYANIGRVTNRGFEANVAYNDRAGNVNYFVNFNASFARSRIDRTDEVDNRPLNLRRTGHAVGQPFGLVAVGYYKDQADIDASPRNALYRVRPGDIKYMDVNGDNIIDETDEVAIGKSEVPEWNLGFSAGAEYKGFDISFLISAFLGRSVLLDNANAWAFRNNGNATSIVAGAWEAGVREDDASYPRLTTEDNRNNYRTSTYWLKNGDFLRLSNVEIGYTFPKKWMEKARLGGLRVFANGQNLLTADNLGKYNVDPEVIDAGLTGYPMTRSFNFGLKLQF